MRKDIGKIAAGLALAVLVLPATMTAAKNYPKSTSSSSVYVNDTGSCTLLEDNTIENNDEYLYIVVKFPDGTDPSSLTYTLLNNGKYVETLTAGLYGTCTVNVAVLMLEGDYISGYEGSRTVSVNYPNGKTFSNDSFRLI